MLTENGLTLDGDALENILEKADLITVGFTLLPQRLLIDTRANATDGPMVAIVAPVATVQERYLWLGKHRPSFGAPEAFSFFVWPHTIRHLVESDALAPVRARLEAAQPGAGETFAKVLEQLAAAEATAIRGAISGEDGWITLFQRAA